LGRFVQATRMREEEPTEEYLWGMHAVQETVRAKRRTIYGAYLNELSRPRLKKLGNFLESRKVPVVWTNKGELFRLANTKEHQGVILQCAPYQYAKVPKCLSHSRVLLTDNIEDPHNLGAMLRSADAFGFHGVLLPNKGVPGVYASVMKASAGAAEFLDITRERTANQYIKHARDAGFKIYALDGAGKARLNDIEPKEGEKILLVIGGEDRGVGQFILNEADAVLNIPGAGRVNSLNASVAAGIALHALGDIREKTE